MEEKNLLPNSTLILVLGILSIPCCCCFGGGSILSIVALFLARTSKKIYDSNPEKYEGYQHIKIGVILAIIGLLLSLYYIVSTVMTLNTLGWELLGDPELLREKLEEMQQNY